MTDAFEDGARLMAGALGAADYGFVVIDHPIASATDSELEQRAMATIRQAGRLLFNVD